MIFKITKPEEKRKQKEKENGCF